MSRFQLRGLAGETASESLFGGNILAPRTTMTGEGSYDALIRDLGVTDLRYPGGTLTEEYFDLTAPDAAQATHMETGEVIDFIPISDFIANAQTHGSSVTLVLPTRSQLSDETDANGDRLPDIDEAALRSFVSDVVTGRYGEIEVSGFEIGNEYWASGQMNSAEYGRLAAEMARIVSDTLDGLEAQFGLGGDTDVLVQMGTNFGYAGLDDAYEGYSGQAVLDDLNARYGTDLGDEVLRSSGAVDWAEVSNRLIMNAFDDSGAETIDGIIAHVYSKEQVVEGQRSFHLETVEETWGASYDDLDLYVTEWNTSGHTSLLDRGEDYGLYQAHEMLDIVEQFMLSGVDVAHAWPLLQNTANTFSYGFSHEALTPGGEMFALMSESLPGLRMLDLHSDARETEAEGATLDLHAFADDNRMVLFLASTSDDTDTTTVDLSGLLTGWGEMTAVRLGVAEGAHPGNTAAEAVLTQLDPSDITEGQSLTVTLAPGEILRVTLADIVPAQDFALGGGSVELLDPDADGHIQIAHWFRDQTDTQDAGPDIDAGPSLGAFDWLGSFGGTFGGLRSFGQPARPATDNTETPDAPVSDTPVGQDAPLANDDDSASPFDTIASFGWSFSRGGTQLFGSGTGGGFGSDPQPTPSDDPSPPTGGNRIDGSQGADLLRGAEGDDHITGGAGRDSLHGNDGDDRLVGHSGYDLLKGGDGNDHLFGGAGNDTLKGGQGDDWLDGADGDNLIHSGFGRDTISFNDEGIDFSTRVTDFALGRDVLRFEIESVDDLDDLVASRTDDGASLRIWLNGNADQEILLDGDFELEDLIEAEAITLAS